MGAAFAHSGKRNRETTHSSVWRKPKEFLRRFVIVDEKWIHWYTSVNKDQPQQWTLPYEPTKKLLPFSGIHNAWST